jgi:hypothetical protein
MANWIRRVRGALGMGITWAIAWAIAGVLIGASSLVLTFLPWDAFFRVFDAPLPALAIPGFISGAIFSVVLGIAGRRRRFDQLSMPWFTALGAAGGMLLGAVAVSGGFPVGTLIFTGVLAAGSAAGTLALARGGDQRELPGKQPREPRHPGSTSRR